MVGSNGAPGAAKSGTNVCVVDLNGPFGPLRSFLELYRPLTDMGAKLHFVIPQKSVDLLMAQSSGRATYAVVEGPHSVRRDIRVAAAVRDARADGYAVVHANSTSAVRGSALGSRDLVVHLRNSSLSRGEGLLLNAVRALPFSHTTFVAPSRLAASKAPARVVRDCRVIPNAVSGMERREARPLAAVPVVGVVANQQLTKGFDLVPEVARCLAGRPVEWRIFGSAGIKPSESEYVRTAQERLSMIEGVSTRYMGVVELATEFRQLDALLVTSRRESFSRVSAEALIAGVPLVAPEIPGLIDTIDGDRRASVYPAEQPEAAAAQLAAVLDHYERSIHRASDARVWAMDRYSPAAVAQQLSEVYAAAQLRAARRAT